MKKICIFRKIFYIAKRNFLFVTYFIIMYNSSWENVAPCDMANYLAYLRTLKDSSNLADVTTKTAEAVEQVSRIPQNLPDQQPNEWIKINGEWIVSPDNYND